MQIEMSALYSDTKRRLRSKTEMMHLIFTITNRLEFSPILVCVSTIRLYNVVPKPDEYSGNDLRF